LTGRRAHGAGENLSELGDLWDGAELVEQSFRRFGIEEELQPLAPLLEGGELESSQHPPAGGEEVDGHRHGGARDVLEEKRGASPFDRPVGDLRNLQPRRDGSAHAYQLPVLLEGSEKGRQVAKTHEDAGYLGAVRAKPSRTQASTPPVTWET
jgi:hypothetical protein